VKRQKTFVPMVPGYRQNNALIRVVKKASPLGELLFFIFSRPEISCHTNNLIYGKTITRKE
jgi:hypothetical protein